MDLILLQIASLPTNQNSVCCAKRDTEDGKTQRHGIGHKAMLKLSNSINDRVI